jgi:hypothetical protein
MGIAQFYSVFKQTYPETIYTILRRYETVAFDMNQWIHQRFDHDVHHLAAEALKMITWHVRVSGACQIIVVMDGVCPYPKLKLQRERRQKSQRVCVSVGTDYMRTFSDVLRASLTTQLSPCLKAIYYSDTLVPGEGEHKIAHAIRYLGLTNVLVICIDADFIMLALLNRLEGVHVWRHCRYYSDIVDISQVLTRVQRPMNFFVNACLLGNDFLPRLTTKMWPLGDYVDDQDVFEPEKLCLGYGATEDTNVTSYVQHLKWCIDYYRDYRIGWIPACEPPKKMTLDYLRQCRFVDDGSLAQEPPAYSDTLEFQLLYTLPIVHLPDYLKLYIHTDDGEFMDETNIELFLLFWNSIFGYEHKKCLKITSSNSHQTSSGNEV